MMSVASFAETLLGSAASNLAVALPLGCAAWWIQVKGRRPMLAHLLWLIVLVKLVTPPLVAIPLLNLPPPATPAIPSSVLPPTTVAPTVGVTTAGSGLATYVSWQTFVAGLWLLGSLTTLVWSTTRVLRFDRLLAATSTPADARLDRMAAELAPRFGLGRLPAILTTSATISPLVWWVGGRAHVYVPRAMLGRLDDAELRLILAHELGHVRRGDHYVRALEWLACVTLWWNPVAWWARRNLRINEEICCDALVVAAIHAPPGTYAGALVNAMALLAAPSTRPSAMASGAFGGNNERRIKMILSRHSIARTPGWLRRAVLAGAVLIVPLGFTIGQELGGIDRAEEWIDAGVNSAYLTEEQAEIMLAALRSERQGVTGEQVSEELALIRAQAKRELADAIEFAREHIYRQAELGLISGDEATARIRDLEGIFEAGLSANPAAYFDNQVEAGLITPDVADRRLRGLLEIEQEYNARSRQHQVDVSRVLQAEIQAEADAAAGN